MKAIWRWFRPSPQDDGSLKWAEKEARLVERRSRRCQAARRRTAWAEQYDPVKEFWAAAYKP